jgi:flagellar motility protein MotE (MotC chaperone)
MAEKKNKYIEQDLEWLRAKVDDMKRYVDDRPVSNLTDRMGHRTVKGGGIIPYVIQTIEAQRQDLAKALKEIAEILDAISKLEKAEENKKLLVRGGEELTPMESGEIT